MTRQLLALLLVFSGATAVACPDGVKTMDAKAPDERKPVVAEPAATTQARSQTSKARVAKTSTRPAVAVAVPAEAKKPAGG